MVADLSARLRRQAPSPCTAGLARPASEGILPRSKSVPRRVVPVPGPAGPSKKQHVAPPVGVSVAFLINFCSACAEQRPEPTKVEKRLTDELFGNRTTEQLEEQPAWQSTRAVALELKRKEKEAEVEGPFINRLEEERHAITGGLLCGPALVHVAHAWDSSFSDLVGCIVRDSAGEMDCRYSLDVFSTDMNAPPSDPVAVITSTVAGAQEVLLVLDDQGVALSRLWVLFEAILALEAGKLRVRAPGGFGNSTQSLKQWEAAIDAADWVLAQATRGSDEKRLRAYAQKHWETHGKGTERLLAQFKKFIRREIYGQILVGAVAKGDRAAVEAVLEKGASPAQQDSYGNTVEEIAASHGWTDIEELLFDRRMERAPMRSLGSFFEMKELMASAQAASHEVLVPFLTEPEVFGEASGSEDEQHGDYLTMSWHGLLEEVPGVA